MLFVNIEPRSLLDGSWQRTTPRGRIVLEITEHEQIHDHADFSRVVAQHRSKYLISLDDVFSHKIGLLELLRPDFLKLDRFESGLAKALVEYCTAVGIGVIAEGIESEQELARVRSLNIRYAQGYLFGLPSELSGGHGPGRNQAAPVAGAA